jgi:hypothetical protein
VCVWVCAFGLSSRTASTRKSCFASSAYIPMRTLWLSPVVWSR